MSSLLITVSLYSDLAQFIKHQFILYDDLDEDVKLWDDGEGRFILTNFSDKKADAFFENVKSSYFVGFCPSCNIKTKVSAVYESHTYH